MCRNISTKDINAAIKDIYPESNYQFRKNISVSNVSKIHMINKKYFTLDLSPIGLDLQMSAPYVEIKSEETISPFILWIEKIFECDFIKLKQCMYTYLNHAFMDTYYMINQLIDELYNIYTSGHDYSNTIEFIHTMIEV